MSKHYLPTFEELRKKPIQALNDFFCANLKTFINPAKDAATIIKRSNGNATLNEIASTCNKSHRQTERIFHDHIGLTPKQFCKIMKYSRTLELLNSKPTGETLLGIALEAGYYDHAHLAKEFKKITRKTPSGK